jgi:hypothetical protein
VSKQIGWSNNLSNKTDLEMQKTKKVGKREMKSYTIHFHAILNIDAKNREEADKRATKFFNNLCTWDFEKGTCDSYEIDKWWEHT